MTDKDGEALCNVGHPIHCGAWSTIREQVGVGKRQRDSGFRKGHNLGHVEVYRHNVQSRRPHVEQSCDQASPALHLPSTYFTSLWSAAGFLHHHTARPSYHRRPHPVTATAPLLSTSSLMCPSAFVASAWVSRSSNFNVAVDVSRVPSCGEHGAVPATACAEEALSRMHVAVSGKMKNPTASTCSYRRKSCCRQTTSTMMMLLAAAAWRKAIWRGGG
jgi:hypothetical protein